VTHHIEVLGFDCAACRKTYQLIEEVARELDIDIRLEKVSDPARIAAYRALSVPGIAIDGKLVHSGSKPSRKTIEAWLSARPHPEGGASHD
jgi:predicted thioredoxin/glutaredoxin